MWFMHLSLVNGWLPAVVAAVGWGSLVLGVAWWRRAMWHWILICGAAGAVAAVGAWLLDVPSRVGGTYPPSFVVWAALPLFALGAAIWHWGRAEWWRRLVALLAVPGLMAFGGLQMNAHYDYLPTLGDLLGAPLPGQVSAAQLEHGSRSWSIWPSARHAAVRAGEVAEVDIPAPISHFHARSGFVWLPPAYFARPRPRLPVLMLLSGVPGTTADWLRGGGALQVANGWASAHEGWAPIMVFPVKVLMSYDVPKRWFIQSAVGFMICIVPRPPSHATMVDCQPLSCQATAYMMFAGTLIVGALVYQKCLAPAASSALRTSARLAAVPL